jgi:hypothetical protein
MRSTERRIQIANGWTVLARGIVSAVLLAVLASSPSSTSRERSWRRSARSTA